MATLSEIVSDLFLSEDPRRANKLWESARRALAGVHADRERVQRILAKRDLTGLARLATEMAGSVKAKTIDQAGQREGTITGISAPVEISHHENRSSPETNPSPEIDHAEQLKHAMKAFRKRLKLTLLDDESKLGHRAMTGGRHSNIVAIMPPREYSREVWDELVKQGKLKDSGGGFYALAE